MYIDSNGEISIPSNVSQISGCAFNWVTVKDGNIITQDCDACNADDFADDSGWL